MKFKNQICFIVVALFLQSCAMLGGGNLSHGKKSEWVSYETKIGDTILQYSLPNGQSRNSPKIMSPKNKIVLTGQVENIFHGFWDFSSSKFKQVEVTLKCSIGVSSLKDSNIKFIDDKIDLNSFKNFITRQAKQDWKKRNEDWLKKADYFSPLKFVSPSGFEEIIINNKVWIKFYNPHLNLVTPINLDILVGMSVYKDYSSPNKELHRKANQMMEKIIYSFNIKKLNR